VGFPIVLQENIRNDVFSAAYGVSLFGGEVRGTSLFKSAIKILQTQQHPNPTIIKIRKRV
jgi:hypothetical protein